MDEIALSEVMRLLHVPSHKRTVRDIQMIVQHTKAVKFLAEQESAVHEACCQVMKYAEFEPDSYIFRVGDPGDSFCIILKGRVSVQLPSSHLSKDTRQLVKSEKEIKTETPAARIFLYTKKILGISLVRKTSDLKERAGVQDNLLVSVSEMTAGACFGELALLQGLPRSATIQCLERTVVGVLSKEGFNLVLKEHEAKKLNWKINFLQSTPMFASWTRQALSRLTYYLKERKFRRLDRVYEEGAPAHEAYIVVEGEFKLTKNCKVQREAAPFKTSARRTQLQVVIKGSRELFGELDLLSDQVRSMNCSCVSSTGLLWAITKPDFTQRIQNLETWSFIYRRNERQTEWMSHRLDKLLSVEEHKLFSPRQLTAQGSPTCPSPKLKASLQLFSNINCHVRTKSVSSFKPSLRRHRTKLWSISGSRVASPVHSVLRQ